MPPPNTPEHRRLLDSENRRADWKEWGTYLAERAWGTVREDYSAPADPWRHFPHDHARSRTYRWNEDGLGGFCNRFQNLCLAWAFWNGKDPFLKERLFGVSGHEGNHGEDVKEHYYYLDATPTHSWARMLYQYPQVAFPYQRLIEENQRRDRDEPEYEIDDALREIGAEDRKFDIFIEWAKAAQHDILGRVRVVNRGPEAATIHVLPHIWFRNTWSWGYGRERPELAAIEGPTGTIALRGDHHHLGECWWYADVSGRDARLLFTDNDSNVRKLWGVEQPGVHPKDAFHEAIVAGREEALRSDSRGTKAAVRLQAALAPGESFEVRVRLTLDAPHRHPFDDFDDVMAERLEDADAFYDALHHVNLTEDERDVQRQALAGLLWSKQFYHLSVEKWLNGDPAGPAPPAARKTGRNADWTHLYNLDVISMPDKWEYPWYAAWDLAFHAIPLAMVDPEWAKRQLVLLLREWYMHPNGQIPAYEWSFGDVNPPVHAWAAWRVYKIDKKLQGRADTAFLERVFHKLLLNFTWWVNRKDAEGRNVFQGGFLGLDNIGVFDRSSPLPSGGHLEQADGTAWMGMYCLNMMAIALELARTRPAYEDVATKFFEHFIYIANAIKEGLWNHEDGFFYDQLHLPNGHIEPMRTRSFVGLIPLFAVETLEPDLLERLPRFRRRMQWFVDFRPKLAKRLPSFMQPGEKGRRLLSLVDRTQLERILVRMLDETQFLSPYGLRSLSREHHENPFVVHVNGDKHTVRYEPAESTSGMFGGNSNWRGPIWFPLNYLMIESLQKFHHYYGEQIAVELPARSGNTATLEEVARDISRRLISIFLPDRDGRRPALRSRDTRHDEHVLFHEYFHGDTGAGLGAAHQTGWTALVAKLIDQSGGKP